MMRKNICTRNKMYRRRLTESYADFSTVWFLFRPEIRDDDLDHEKASMFARKFRKSMLSKDFYSEKFLFKRREIHNDPSKSSETHKFTELENGTGLNVSVEIVLKNEKVLHKTLKNKSKIDLIFGNSIENIRILVASHHVLTLQYEDRMSIELYFPVITRGYLCEMAKEKGIEKDKREFSEIMDCMPVMVEGEKNNSIDESEYFDYSDDEAVMD